jgi:predicted PurR-regulated permease PerM
MGIENRLTGSMRRLRDNQRRRSEDRLAQRAQYVAQAMSDSRDNRRDEPSSDQPTAPQTSNFTNAKVPYGVDLAAAWAWRVLVVGALVFFVGRLIAKFEVVVLPLVVALLLTALVIPLVNRLQRWGLPRGVAGLLVVVGSLALIALLLTFAGQQVASSANDLANQVVDGLEKIRIWLRTGPLKFSDTQINGAIKQAQDYITSGNRHLVSRVGEVGTALGHVLAGFFIVLFATYFFLADGNRIWSWLVRIFPRAARSRADSSGRVAWHSLTRFVRATVLVAITDALGIMLVAWILKVPLVFAIGILVFLGAFVPVVGATASGSVAVLVALVAHGPIVALVMLAGVIAVQQLEAHVLQPFLLGRFVAVHPLAVILAIAAGVLVAGIPGALVAVPLVAALNAIVLHLAATAGQPPEPEPGSEPPDEPPDEPPAQSPNQSPDQSHPPETTEGPDAEATSRPS